MKVYQITVRRILNNVIYYLDFLSRKKLDKKLAS